MNRMPDDHLGRVATVSEFLFREAHYLDTRQFELWLSLYAEDCEYWVPAWKDETHYTQDPQVEMSLIYCSNRSGLEDRVWRVKSGTSIASKVLPRTQHQITNIVVDWTDESPEQIRTQYQWCVHQFNPKKQTTDVLFGSGEATIGKRTDRWLYLRKKVVLLNDHIPTKLDFYSV